MKVLFLGSSRFSKIVLAKMLEKGINVVKVITQPDKPSGRGYKLTETEVKRFAIENNIDVLTFDKIKNHMEEVKKIDYDVSVVASFGQILPDEFLEHRLAINVHPSLLPKYRGASPIQTSLLNGDSVTGVTIMKIASEVDSGDILLQQEFKLNDEYYLELEEKLALLGGEMVAIALKMLEEGKANFIPQDSKKATFVKKITKADGKLDFNCPCSEIVNKVRALSEEVGCFVEIDDKILKIGKVKKVEDYLTEPCQILNNKKAFIIGCKDGAIEILTCQAPSGKMISGRDYINGHNDILGKKVK